MLDLFDNQNKLLRPLRGSSMGGRFQATLPGTGHFTDYPLKIYGIWSTMKVKDIRAFLYNTIVSIFTNQGAQNVQFNFDQNVKFPAH